MQALEKVRSQIDGLKKLHNIVRTMKALSAANIRQYENSVQSLADYFRNVERGLHVVLKSRPEGRWLQDLSTRRGEDEYAGDWLVDDVQRKETRGEPKPRSVAAVVFGTDYGLCGRFNSDVAEFTVGYLQALDAQPTSNHVLVVGDRLQASFAQLGVSVDDVMQLPGAAAQISFTVQAISVQIDEWQRREGIEAVYLFYNRRFATKRFQPTGFKVWPIELSRFRDLEEQQWPSRCLPTYRLPPVILLARLLQQYLFVTLSRACAVSQASEHASRLSAMQVAERNLNDHLEALSMEFRRERQNTITAELLDVMSGYESVREQELE